VLGVVELCRQVHGDECTKTWLCELVDERLNGS
jgi:hypothetical protein